MVQSQPLRPGIMKFSIFCFLGLCLHNGLQEACDHERHIFGTLDHFVASVKLGVLIFMTVTNVRQKCYWTY